MNRIRGEVASRIKGLEQAFYAYLDLYDNEAQTHANMTILGICRERERLLREYGFEDPYRHAKNQATAEAYSMLPQVLKEIDALPDIKTIRCGDAWRVCGEYF